ncbi:MAG: SH3 domain-containing protein [Saprospiraceae bacterium]|nr:SH3 domain-containing protein [Saprospiraceae bacterium]
MMIKIKMPKFVGRGWVVLVSIILLIVAFMLFQANSVSADPFSQIPTGSIATVTGTLSGPIVTVRLDLDQPSVNLRAGPHTTIYKIVGVLLLGQKVPARGISPGGDWILIEYPGAPDGVAWVYAPYVNKTPGDLKIVQPPPTPKPQYTATIDPTMAAQFVVTIGPTRLASYTPPPPLVIPTFAAQNETGVQSQVPMGLVIIALAAIGLFTGIFSLTQGR